jgi:hypothetical protein
LQQFTTAISAQNEEAIESNYLCRNKILRQVSREESKKDCTQKIHLSIIKMICRVAALCSTNETGALPATCSCFINQETREWLSTIEYINSKNKSFTMPPLPQGQQMLYTWEGSCMPIPAPPVILQFLLFTSKSQTRTIASKIIIFAA